MKIGMRATKSHFLLNTLCLLRIIYSKRLFKCKFFIYLFFLGGGRGDGIVHPMKTEKKTVEFRNPLQRRKLREKATRTAKPIKSLLKAY